MDSHAPVAPTPPRQRVASLDVLRGAAVLGILLLNVRSFAMPSDGYVYPVADATADVATYAITTAAGQGKFLAIFAALYGAGVTLLAPRGDGVFLRRTAILAGVGLLHMAFVWHGDVLLLYATCGLAAWAMRHVPTLVLWLVAAAGHAFTVGVLALLYAALTLGGQDVPMLDGPAGETAAFLGGYGDQLAMRLTLAARDQVAVFLLFGPATLSLMLAGMALMRTGFFSGDWSPRQYGAAATLGWLGGVGGSGLIVAAAWRAGWPVDAWVSWGQLGLELLSPLAALGIAASVIATAGRWSFLAPVGRMAFTNYLAQSLLGTFAFYGGWGLGSFGSVGYARQLGFVFAVWVLQIAWSHLWLARFRHGPLEWLWRQGTYGKRLPLRSPP